MYIYIYLYHLPAATFSLASLNNLIIWSTSWTASERLGELINLSTSFCSCSIAMADVKVLVVRVVVMVVVVVYSIVNDE